MPTTPWLALVAISPLIACLLYPIQVNEKTSQPRISRAAEFQENEAAAHLIGDWPDIRLDPSQSKAYHPFEGIRFRVTVDVEGNVVEVVPEDSEDRTWESGVVDQGKKIIRELKFRPFIRRGRQVPARFAFYMPVFPPEERPLQHTVFPDLIDRNSLVITLDRGGCYGTCPIYKIDIHGDGTVDYEGKCFVAVRGRRAAKISTQAVDGLFELFKSSDYFSLREEYESPATDLPTFITSISFDGHVKSVTDYYGVEMGMSDSVKRIERSIDKATDSALWISKHGTWKPSKRKPCV